MQEGSNYHFPTHIKIQLKQTPPQNDMKRFN